uniref:Uncharacterized protein n=1 Tax=Anguilla anguilla TaxID=7936 RepID=A0A0E9UVN8_ANGAN
MYVCVQCINKCVKYHRRKRVLPTAA